MKQIFGEIISKVKLFIDIGIKIEIRDYLEELDTITDYKLIESKDNYYIIKIKLNEFSKQDIEDLFEQFIKYMKYGHGVFYVRDIEEREINYKFLTFNKDMVGFYCDICYYKD